MYINKQPIYVKSNLVIFKSAKVTFVAKHEHNVENFRNFLQLRFYVKSIFGISEVPKIAILTFSVDMNIDFEAFLHFQRVEVYPKAKFRASETAKTAVFELLEYSKLISRKI